VVLDADNRVIATYPAVLKYFNPADLDSLWINGSLQNADNLIEFVSHLKGLHYLQLATLSLSEKSASLLAPLTNLDSLSICNCDADPSMLARIKILPDLQMLSIMAPESDSMESVAPLLHVLSKRNSLRDLRFEKIFLSTEEIGQVAKFQNLTRLCIRNSNISNEELENLTKLKNLNYLDLACNFQLTTKCTDSLKQFKKLKTLQIPRHLLTKKSTADHGPDETALRLAEESRAGDTCFGRRQVTQSGSESLPGVELDAGHDDEPVAWQDRFLPPEQIQTYYNTNLTTWDSDQSGSVSKDEIAEALKSTEGRNYQCVDILDEHFGGIDTDASGEIAPDEIMAINQGQSQFYQALNSEKKQYRNR